MQHGRDRYSSNERKLLTACGVDNDAVFDLQPPSVLFRFVVWDCFKENKQGPHIDALRRACKCWDDGTYGTAKYKSAIEF